MRSFSGVLFVLLLLSAFTPPAASAQTLSRLGPSTPVISGTVRGSNAAYDPKNSQYLVVSASFSLNGVFVTADGVAGPSFTIQGPYASYPSIAYSPDMNDGDGGFLVTWHQSTGPASAVVLARTVSATGVLGPVVGISIGGSWWEAAADVAYSSTSQEFLVVWQGAGIIGQRVGLNGALLGTNFPINNPVHGRDPAVVYNPTNNEYFITFGDIDASSNYAAGQRVAAGTGALVGPQIVLGRAVGVYITEVAYNSTTNQYLAAWWQGGTYGVLVDPSGTLASSVLPLSLTVSAYDALGIDFNVWSGTFLMVSHVSSSFQDGAIELAGGTAIPGTPIIATDIAAAKGNFYPKAVARSDKSEWIMSFATDFVATTVQRLQSSAVGVPPPPPCTATPSVTSFAVPSGQTSFSINVAADATCVWRATSSVSWLQIFYGAKTTGPGVVGVSVLHNTSSVSRTATITISGQKVTVQQSGFNAAATTDFDGDGTSDVLWQSKTTRSLGIWTLRGNTVTSIQWLDTLGPADPSWKLVGSGDVNGDGFADLVWQNTSDGTVAVWVMHGTMLLISGLVNYVPVTNDWHIRGVGDVNGDGRADLIWQNDIGGLAVWQLNGFNVTAASLLSVPSVADTNWLIAGAGDVDGDGKADLVWQNKATGAIGVWFMNGATVMQTKAFSIATVSDLNWKINGVGDVNGDTKADLLWLNGSTGEVGVWYLDGNVVTGYAFLSIPKVGDLTWTMVGPG
jgi:VCBS repeat protein